MSGQSELAMAPELLVAQWFKTKTPLSLEKLRGKIVVIEAFQMLCPGCVSHGLPQAQNIRRYFSPESVEVIGLHTVFEHHAAMTPVSLEAFIHEYRLDFPIGVDESGANGMPKTMEAFDLRGTPSLVIVDQKGRLRASHFGHVSDLQIGAEIAHLLAGHALNEQPTRHKLSVSTNCDDNGCPI